MCIGLLHTQQEEHHWKQQPLIYNIWFGLGEHFYTDTGLLIPSMRIVSYQLYIFTIKFLLNLCFCFLSLTPWGTTRTLWSCPYPWWSHILGYVTHRWSRYYVSCNMHGWHVTVLMLTTRLVVTAPLVHVTFTFVSPTYLEKNTSVELLKCMMQINLYLVIVYWSCIFYCVFKWLIGITYYSHFQ